MMFCICVLYVVLINVLVLYGGGYDVNVLCISQKCFSRFGCVVSVFADNLPIMPADGMFINDFPCVNH